MVPGASDVPGNAQLRFRGTADVPRMQPSGAYMATAAGVPAGLSGIREPAGVSGVQSWSNGAAGSGMGWSRR